MRSPREVLDLYRTRQSRYTPLHAKMREIQAVYNGEAEIPLPDMDRSEKPSIPNLLAQGVDQMAGRITSVTPQVTFASAKPGVRKYDRLAVQASDTITGWWQSDKVMMKMKNRGRRLIAYGMAPTVLRWNYKEHRPTWEIRHPLETFPSPDLAPGKVTPEDCIFAFQRSVGWLQAHGYDEHLRTVAGRDYDTLTRDTQITMIEYIDADTTMLMVSGYFNTNYVGSSLVSMDMFNGWVAESNGLRGVVCEMYENFGDDTPVTIPTRLTLDSMTGQFDGMLGMYYQQAKLMALETIAVEKGIFPDTYLVSRQGETGRFLDGPWDGRSGRINIIAGGDIKTDQVQPGYMTNGIVDRLERAQRLTAGIPQEFGGESTSNIRTGRRGDAVLSAVVDFPVAEAQEIFAFSLEEENEAAIAMAKRIDGSTSRTLFVGTGNAARPVTYKPTETFEVEEHVVSYPAAGTDLNGLVIGLGQRVGLGIMSKKTAAVLDPYIDNPEVEHDLIISEGLEQALMSGIQQQAASGQIPPMTVSKIMSLVANDKMELAEAINKVTEDALKEQQAQQEAAQQGQPPSPMTGEMAMAGAAAGSLTGNPTVSPVAESMPGMNNLGQMLGALRKPGMTIVPGRNIPQGGI